MSRIAVLAAGATLMGAAAGCDDAGKPRADAGATGGAGGAGGAAGSGGASVDAGLPDVIDLDGRAIDAQVPEAPIAIYAAAVFIPSDEA